MTKSVPVILIIENDKKKETTVVEINIGPSGEEIYEILSSEVHKPCKRKRCSDSNVEPPLKRHKAEEDVTLEKLVTL